MTIQALRRTAWAMAGVALLSACNEQRVPQGVQQDQTSPVATIIKSQGDTLTVDQGIVFSVRASDNLGLRRVLVEMSGGLTLTIDSTFSRSVTDITFPVEIPLPANTTAGGNIDIRVTATDGSENAGVAVDSLFLVNSEALTVRLLRPSPGAVTSPGLRILVEVAAEQRTGVRLAGYRVTGVVTDSNSTGFSPLVDSASFVDTLTVPASTAEGTFQVTGFAEDSAGRQSSSTPVTVTVQSITSDTDPPIVTVRIASRVEVRDSITVQATDPSGIALIGWTARTIGAGAAIVGGDSTTVGGGLTEASQQYNLNFNFTTLPQSVEIRGFAVDANGNRGEARVDTTATAAIKRDTVLVVNGITKRLPIGGRVADAIYNRNLNEVYLTNVELDRVEVFRVADTSFVAAGINVGARPWGIALWPGDTLGANQNLVMVANSGGTNISVVDVAARQELRRHSLPNYLVQFVQTEIDPNTGLLKIKIDEFDFSDRPSYVGATCKPVTGGTACAADSIFAVYSTTPTPDQGVEYELRGTVRWENLTASPVLPESHFFYEQSVVRPSPDADTLQLIVDRGPSGVSGNEQQAIIVRNGDGNDTYTLTFNGATTGPIAENATAAQVDAALEALGTIGAGNVTVSQNAAGLYGVTFVGTFAGQDVAGLIPGNQTDALEVSVQELLPGIQLSAACGITVDRRQLAFAESTYVRNSGNFTHALVGEGGVVEPALGFARAVGYNRITGMAPPSICGGSVQGVAFIGPFQRDFGISSALRVRDFISNTAIPVRSIGVNFNGLTNMIRADSVYVLDEALRLTGSFPADGNNPGIDLFFAHDFDARAGGTPGTNGQSGDPDDRLLFVARDEPQVDVFDTWFYQRVATIQIRDPINGPLRVARLPSGDEVIIGVTAKGVVTVRLPAGTISNPLPVMWGGDETQ